MLNWREKLKKIIPGRLQFKLVSFKHTFTKFRQRHYSQNGEDVVLNNLFPKDYRGFYVDVGAHHPYRISNTALLHEKGWEGINIDANPDTIKLFEKMRPDDTNIHLGVSSRPGSLKYHRFSDPAVNTFSDEEAEKWKHKKWLSYLGTQVIQTKTLVEILNDSLPSGQTIDVLNVDVEGLDFEVLKSNDWQRFRPQIIVVEDHTFTFNEAQENSIYRYLCDEQGYVLDSKLNFSLIFKQQ